MKIKATCKGTIEKTLGELENFQNEDFKKITPESFEKLKSSLRKHGIFAPVFVWKGKNALADGHHRIKALKELKKDGFEIDKIPCVEIEAKDSKELAEKILLINSKYARITEEGLASFEKIFDLDLGELPEIDLPEIDLDFRNINLLHEMETGDNKGFRDFINESSEEFSITFLFEKKNKELCENYIRKNGKKLISENIINFILNKNA